MTTGALAPPATALSGKCGGWPTMIQDHPVHNWLSTPHQLFPANDYPNDYEHALIQGRIRRIIVGR